MQQVIGDLDILGDVNQYRPMSVAEMFYSIQGEGKTTGVLAYFIRLAACNLECGGKGSTRSGQLHDGATWRCDSMEVWKKGKPVSNTEIERTFARMSSLDHFDSEEAMNKFMWNIANGAHIVITGGEPLLQDQRMIYFLEDFFHTYKHWKKKNHAAGPEMPFVEVETNGTISPSMQLINMVSLWNVSPKLSNSGMPAERRINRTAIGDIIRYGTDYQFKFVIDGREDFMEVVADYIVPYKIPGPSICLMPACDNAVDLPAKSQEVINICMANGLKFSPRLHIHIWNQKTGV
jgi:7-carboxy-7-deazaguanine synthase